MRKMKFIFIPVVCLITILGFIGLGKSTLTEASAVLAGTPTPTPAQRWYTETKPMPEELTYWVLFKEIQTLRDRDAQNAASGDATFFKQSFYQDRLGLTSAQFSSLDSIAADCMSQLQPVDQRAKQVIDAYRASYTNGKLRKAQPSPPSIIGPRPYERVYEPLPPVPAELTQLQNQKNQIILNAKERLRQAFGASGFVAFDTAAHYSATKVLSPINMGNNTMPGLTPTPTPTP